MKTKEKIQHYMLGLMLKKGYEGVSVSDIQTKTGMARGLLYHYFSSYDNLKREVILDLVDKISLGEIRDIKRFTISEFISSLIEHYQSLTNLLQQEYGNDLSLIDLKILILDAARQNNDLKDAINKQKTDHYALWRSSVLNSFGKGQLKSGTNLESISRYFQYIEDGFFFNQNNHLTSDITYNLSKRLLEFYEMIER